MIGKMATIDPYKTPQATQQQIEEMKARMGQPLPNLAPTAQGQQPRQQLENIYQPTASSASPSPSVGMPGGIQDLRGQALGVANKLPAFSQPQPDPYKTPSINRPTGQTGLLALGGQQQQQQDPEEEKRLATLLSSFLKKR